MYEFESLFDNTVFIVNFILSLILLIIFLRMAWNISQIRQHLTTSSATHLRQKAEKHEFKGEKEKAIDVYLDLLYTEATSTSKTIDEIKSSIESIQKKIVYLGGEIPESTKEVIKMNIG
ncbi:MAG: hypothetical protein ACQERU_10005 [Bacteroidota bacterium]